MKYNTLKRVDMCMNCFPTMSEIEKQKEDLRKSKEFEMQVCRTCGHFQKDTDFWDVIGVCSISGLSVAGAAVCSIDRWVEKKNK
jgi:hypothetical protein